MNIRFVIVSFVCIIVLKQTGFSAPAYSFESLLERAAHVFLVRLSSQTGTSATFEVTEVLRDDMKSVTLSFSPAVGELPRTSGLLLFSQGDEYWGDPKPVLSVRQPTKGQSSYCGWILESGPGDNARELEGLREIVKGVPYQPKKHGEPSSKALEPTAGTASITLDETIRETAMKRKPAVLDMTIGYHEIRGLEGQSRWHILDTGWWVELHHIEITLDKTKQYEIHGVVLDQRYGTIDVWVYDIKEKN